MFYKENKCLHLQFFKIFNIFFLTSDKPWLLNAIKYISDNEESPKTVSNRRKGDETSQRLDLIQCNETRGTIRSLDDYQNSISLTVFPVRGCMIKHYVIRTVKFSLINFVRPIVERCLISPDWSNVQINSSSLLSVRTTHSQIVLCNRFRSSIILYLFTLK